MVYNSGTTMNPQMKPVMKYKEELFQYIVDHSIKNEQHYNEHLKYDILVQLERKVVSTILLHIIKRYNKTNE